MGYLVYITGLYWDNGKENGNYRDYRGSMGIIGHILGLYWDDEKKMETTVISGLYRGYICIYDPLTYRTHARASTFG